MAGFINAIGDFIGSITEPSTSEQIAVKNLNSAETALRTVRDDYLAGEASLSAQQNALNIIDQASAWLISTQGLNNPALGSWGKQGILDRQKGGKYSWIAAYRDPIANDPRVSGVTGTVVNVVEPISTALGTSNYVVWVGIIAVVGIVAWKKYKK